MASGLHPAGCREPQRDVVGVTAALIKDGREVDKFVGARAAAAIEAFLAPHLGPSPYERLMAEYAESGSPRSPRPE